MRYILEPVAEEELAFCNGCSKNACNNWENNSGNVDVEVSVELS